MHEVKGDWSDVLRLFTLSVLLLMSLAAGAAVPEGIAPIAGRFAGTAYNGGDMDPVVTVLAFDDQGRFAGSYAVEDESGVFEGTLSGLVQEDERSYSLAWTDQHGEGFVLLEFNADFSAFSGFWTNTDGEQQFPWSGRRQ